MSRDRVDRPIMSSKQRVAQVERRLRDGVDTGLVAMVGSLVDASPEPKADLAALLQLFASLDKLPLFFRLLAGLVVHGTSSFAVACMLVVLGERLRRTQEAMAIIERRRSGKGVGFTIGPHDFLPRLRDADAQDFLLRLKYAGAALHAGTAVLDLANKTAPRIGLEEGVSRALWAHSRLQATMTEDAWLADVRVAYAVDHILMDVFALKLASNWDFLDRVAWAGVRDKVDALGKTALLCTFHGGLFGATRQVFASVEGWTTMASRAVADRAVITVIDRGGAAALFGALRLLQDGCVLLTAPDGPQGRKSQVLTVFGEPLPVGDGTAFLAYEADCPTGWFAVVHGPTGMLVPQLVIGPRRIRGEAYPQFRLRFLRFYGERIEMLLSGDPRNLALRPLWSRHFRESA